MQIKKTKLADRLYHFEGSLYIEGTQSRPLRPIYNGIVRDIENTQQLKACLRNKVVWPGCYDIVYLASDGEILCQDCVRKNLRNVLDSIKHGYKDGWKVTNCLYEATSAEIARECNPDLVSYCAGCSKEFGEIV